MVNKKYILLAGFAALALQPAFAQESSQASWSGRDVTYRGEVYDALDTAYIPSKRMDQHNKYLNHQYPFPAKPRNQWELGVNVGVPAIHGDVTSRGPWNSPSFFDAVGFGVTLRKAMGYGFSWRASYNYMGASGYDARARYAGNNRPWSEDGTYSYGEEVYSNYKFRGHEASLQLVGAINNIRFHKAKNSVSLYGFVGAGFLMWNSHVSTRDENGNKYNFASAFSGMDRDEIKGQYKTMLANASNYNYRVVKPSGYRNDWLKTDNYEVSPALIGGVGVQFLLADRVSLQLENKVTWTGLDNLDGVNMDPSLGAGLSPDKDILNYTSVGLGFNLGSKSRSVLPLWWVNPMDHVYHELSDPRHMNVPASILPDSDGDGITDQFDKCPDTPAGVKVDATGCPLDTDGDGVPDYRDKQLITPTECQPVDQDGVGKCPQCCDDMVVAPVAACNIAAGSVGFKSASSTLSNDAKNQLSVLAAQIKANPTCKIVVNGSTGSGSKREQQRSWERVNAVIEYLSNTHQINRNQFIFQYIGTGDSNSVVYRPALPGEEGPSNVVPPHPHLGTRN